MKYTICKKCGKKGVHKIQYARPNTPYPYRCKYCHTMYHKK